MNPALALPVSPAQSQAKIDEVLNRLHRLALESGHPPSLSHTPAHHPQAFGHGPGLAQTQAQGRDTDSLSSHSSFSHSHSHTFSTTTTGTTLSTSSSASSSPSAPSNPAQLLSPSNHNQTLNNNGSMYPPSPRHATYLSPPMLHPPQQPQQQQANPNLANVASLYRLGMPARLQLGTPAPAGYGGPMTPPLTSGFSDNMNLSMGSLQAGGLGSPLSAGLGNGGAPAGAGGGAAGMGLSPTGKAYSYRPGDWICVSPACSYPNFGRNEYCNACRCPRPTSGSLPRSTPPASLGVNVGGSGGGAGMGYTPDLSMSLGMGMGMGMGAQGPRFAGGPRMGGLYAPTGGPVPGLGMGLPPALGAPGLGLGGPTGLGGLGLPSGGPAGMGGMGSMGGLGTEPGRSPMIVTPSGRAFASAGSRKNVSGDEGNPVVIFWPDNEPIPEPGQVRPNMLGLAQPPILNTGNKGPIEHQPGDWYCQKCEHLNWRRRKVCQNCYRFAEGNEDDTTLARQAECISVLIAQLVAAKKAQEAGVLLNLGGMMGVPSGPATPDGGQVTPNAGAGGRAQEGGFFTPSSHGFERAQVQGLRGLPMQMQMSAPAPPVMRGSQAASSLPPATGSLYTPPALAAAQAFEPSYTSHPLGSRKSLSSLSTPPIGHAPGPISPLRMPSSGAPGLTPINTSPTSLRAAIITSSAHPSNTTAGGVGGGMRRVSPPMTPLDPPRSARTNIWGPTSSASSGSPPSKWPDFASTTSNSNSNSGYSVAGNNVGLGGGRRLTPPQSRGTPSPRGSVAESFAGSANGSGGGSVSDHSGSGSGTGSAALGGLAFTPPAGFSLGGAGVGAIGMGVGPVGSPVFRSTHARLAGMYRA